MAVHPSINPFFPKVASTIVVLSDSHSMMDCRVGKRGRLIVTLDIHDDRLAPLVDKRVVRERLSKHVLWCFFSSNVDAVANAVVVVLDKLSNDFFLDECKVAVKNARVAWYQVRCDVLGAPCDLLDGC